MRTVEEEQARYNWLTPKDAAKEIGADRRGKDSGADYVRSLIHDGLLGEPGEVMDIGRRGRPIYLIHPDAVRRFIQESVEKVQRAQQGGEERQAG